MISRFDATADDIADFRASDLYQGGGMGLHEFKMRKRNSNIIEELRIIRYDTYGDAKIDRLCELLEDTFGREGRL